MLYCEEELVRLKPKQAQELLDNGFVIINGEKFTIEDMLISGEELDRLKNKMRLKKINNK